MAHGVLVRFFFLFKFPSVKTALLGAVRGQATGLLWLSLATLSLGDSGHTGDFSNPGFRMGIHPFSAHTLTPPTPPPHPRCDLLAAQCRDHSVLATVFPPLCSLQCWAITSRSLPCLALCGPATLAPCRQVSYGPHLGTRPEGVHSLPQMGLHTLSSTPVNTL